MPDRQPHHVELLEPVAAERHYLDSYVLPVRHLKETLDGILDVEANPDRSPEQALAELRAAVDTFAAETEHWLWGPAPMQAADTALMPGSEPSA